MTDEELKEIRLRYREEAMRTVGGGPIPSARAILSLLDEVDRLKAALATAVEEWDDCLTYKKEYTSYLTKKHRNIEIREAFREEYGL